MKIQIAKYGIVHSSRCVIKSVDGQTKHSNHFYGTDVWDEVLSAIEDVIPAGYTVYGEIVGYTKDGKAIQKGYHYNCAENTNQLRVYRVTSTNQDGKVIEFTRSQINDFCTSTGMQPVRELYYGRASNLIPFYAESETVEQWQARFLTQVEGIYVTDKMCPYNNFEVPAEGVVIKIDGYPEAYKLKNFKFLEWETKQLDAGVVDTETEETLIAAT